MRSPLRPLWIAFLACACTAPREDSSPPSAREATQPAESEPAERDPHAYDPLNPGPWTDAFDDSAALLADTISIEGPRGLIAHCVVQQDAERFTFETEATSEGLLQRTVRRPDDPFDEPIRAGLDRWQIMAMESIEVLERPGPVPVRIVARGDAFWRDPATGAERRGEELLFTGPLDAGEEAVPR